MDSTASPKKAVKKAAAPKKPAAHPAYKDMISDAIKNLKERNGSSRQKIAKYIQANYKGLGDESALKRNLKASLKRLVAAGNIIQTKGSGASGSFKLPASAKKPATGTAKKPAAKKVAKKPATAKKSPAKKSAAAAAKKSPAKKKSAPKKVASKSPKKPKAKIAKKPKAAASASKKSPAKAKAKKTASKKASAAKKAKTGKAKK